MRKAVLWSAAAAALALATVGAGPPNGEISRTFFIAKSSNKNQVHFAVTVDSACAPAGSAPVRPYWQMLAIGPGQIEPLLDREQRAYGISKQAVGGMDVRVVLRALPARPVTIRTFRAADGKCGATVLMTIANAPARLHDVYVKESMFGVDYLLITGWAENGAVVRERVGS